ncbi:hypothetical protein J6590_017719 [Homalodisca vitripennis]|nr:hypothetical protein J6590_017719 [Homalodisca vitripennis]
MKGEGDRLGRLNPCDTIARIQENYTTRHNYYGEGDRLGRLNPCDTIARIQENYTTRHNHYGEGDRLESKNVPKRLIKSHGVSSTIIKLGVAYIEFVVYI